MAGSHRFACDILARLRLARIDRLASLAGCGRLDGFDGLIVLCVYGCCEYWMRVVCVFRRSGGKMVKKKKIKLYKKKIEIIIESHDFGMIVEAEFKINKMLKRFRWLQEKAKTGVMKYVWLHITAGMVKDKK